MQAAPRARAAAAHRRRSARPRGVCCRSRTPTRARAREAVGPSFVRSFGRSSRSSGQSPSRCAHGAAACGAALALLAPAWSCRRARGGVTLGRRSSVAAARSLGARGASCSAARALCVWLWGRSPSRGAHGAAACGAALALLVPAWSCRRARGGETLGRRTSAAAARSLSARGASCSAARALRANSRRARQLALSARTLEAVAVAPPLRRRRLRRRAGALRRPLGRAAALAAA